MVGCCAHIASIRWYLPYYRHIDGTQNRMCQTYENYGVNALSDWSEDEAAEYNMKNVN